MLRLTALASGRGSNVAAIHDAIVRGDLHAELGLIVSNNSGAKVLEYARSHDIPCAHISGKTHPDEGAALLEGKLEKVGGNFTRACVELAKDWRLERRYRQLEALMIVCDAERSLLLSGTGDVIEADDGVLAIGSGGNYALAAARALLRHTDMNAQQVVEEALRVAGEICVFTNLEHTVLTLDAGGEG